MLRAVMLPIVAATLVTGASYASQPTGWICITEASGGVLYDEAVKSWRGGAFKAGRKYIVRRPKSDETTVTKEPVWVVQEFGRQWHRYECGDVNTYGVLMCSFSEGIMKLNVENLRFLLTSESGFVAGVDSGSPTPVIEIGTCAPL